MNESFGTLYAVMKINCNIVSPDIRRDNGKMENDPFAATDANVIYACMRIKYLLR